MKDGNRCCWPRCELPVEATYSLGKGFGLCNKHGDLIQDEDDSIMRRARNKIGIPMPVTVGRMPTREEDEARCAFPDCGYPVSVVCGEIPFCNDHKNRQEEYDFDGIWHKFIPECKLYPAPLFDRKSKSDEFNVDDLMRRLNGKEFDPED